MSSEAQIDTPFQMPTLGRTVIYTSRAGKEHAAIVAELEPESGPRFLCLVVIDRMAAGGTVCLARVPHVSEVQQGAPNQSGTWDWPVRS